jgi:hypothetical protein
MHNAFFFQDGPLSVNYLFTKSLATNKNPAKIIGVMVREKIAE